METEIFERVAEECSKKKVINLCCKLIKKCSIKSGSDMERLCHLAYWLYVYDLPTLSRQCIIPTHEIPFDQNYNVWDFIHAMWGLEIRILKEQNQLEEAKKIMSTINTHFLMPTKFEPTTEEREKMEAKRRSRFTYEDTIKKDVINDCLSKNDIKKANDWRFIALLGMIGNTETECYLNLNENKAKIDNDTKAYIQILNQTV